MRPPWVGGASNNLSPPLMISYEPELFPGLIYRMVKPRIVLLIFVSGKVVLTGTLTISHLSAHLFDTSSH